MGCLTKKRGTWQYTRSPKLFSAVCQPQHAGGVFDVNDCRKYQLLLYGWRFATKFLAIFYIEYCFVLRFVLKCYQEIVDGLFGRLLGMDPAWGNLVGLVALILNFRDIMMWKRISCGQYFAGRYILCMVCLKEMFLYCSLKRSSAFAMDQKNQ